MDDTEVIKLSEKNFQQICRICYQENDLWNLFDSKFQYFTFAAILEKIVHEKIMKMDGLPSSACIKCLKLLLKINAFIEQYKVSSEDLKSAYSYLYNNGSPESSKNFVEISVITIPDEETLLKQCHFINSVKEETPISNAPYINMLNTPIKVEQIETLLIKNEFEDVPQFELSTLPPKERTRKKRNRQDLKLHCVECDRHFKSHNGFRGHQRADHPNIPRPDQEFHCAICSRRYIVKNKLRKHLTVCHNRLTCVCDKCGRTVKRYNFTNHLKTHEGGVVPYKHRNLCTICGVIVKYTMSVHMKQHHSKRKYRCKICPFETVYSLYLKKHELRHKGKLFQCKTCGKDFTIKEFFEKHLKLHEPLVKPMPCNTCSKEFSNQFDFDKHLSKAGSKVHSGLKMFADASQEENVIEHNEEDKYFVGGKLKKPAKRCEECSKICYNYATYLEHMKFEHQIDKRVCTICNKRIQGFMTIHMKTHIAEPLNKKCIPCNKSFNRPAHLKRHNLLIHENKREHKCPYCEKEFKMVNSLEDHIRIHTGETLKCEYCEKTFKQPSTRYKHLREAHNIRLGELKKRNNIDRAKSVVENMELMVNVNEKLVLEKID